MPVPPPDQEGVIYDGSNPRFVLVTDTINNKKWQIPRTRSPSIGRKAANFTKAAIKHAAAGSPRATDAQVDERFAICQQCPSGYYKITQEEIHEDLLPELGTCLHKSCGCVLAPSTYRGKNKLRWADQQCPEGHWNKL